MFFVRVKKTCGFIEKKREKRRRRTKRGTGFNEKRKRKCENVYILFKM